MEIKVLSVNGLETRYGFTISSEVVPRVVSIDKLVSYWISIIFIEIVDIVTVVKEVPLDLLTIVIEVVEATVNRLKTVKRLTIFTKVIPITLVVRNIAIGYHDTSLGVKIILFTIKLFGNCLIVCLATVYKGCTESHCTRETFSCLEVTHVIPIPSFIRNKDKIRLIASSIKIVGVTIFSDKIIFNHLAIFVEVVIA